MRGISLQVRWFLRLHEYPSGTALYCTFYKEVHMSTLLIYFNWRKLRSVEELCTPSEVSQSEKSEDTIQIYARIPP